MGCGDRNLDSSHHSIDHHHNVQQSNDNVETDDSSSMGEKIDLVFEPLEMDEISTMESPIDWKYLKSIPFGQFDKNKAVLDLYIDENRPSQIEGVFNVNNDQYHITSLSKTLMETDQINCPQVCLFQKFFTGESQFELVGSIELFANGPGLRLYIIYDAVNDKLMSFDDWGTPSFIDLDDDGNEEFVIQFEGLHLHWPDISIIISKDNKLMISTSVFSSFEKTEGDFAQLIISENSHPVVSLSNAQREDATFHYYTYNQGTLEKIELENYMISEQ